MAAHRTKLATFDVISFHGKLESKRKELGYTWRQVGAETGVTPSAFTRMGRGDTPDVTGLVSLAMWAGLTIEDFVGECEDFKKPEENQ